MNHTNPTADDRQPAYDAVFAYIRQQPRDFLPATVVDRNAMIWRAVNAALDAVVSPPTDRAELRDRTAEAMRKHYLCTNQDEADADGNLPCRCGDWREPGVEVDDENDWDSHLADVALAVLGEPTDRAAVLLWAADQIARMPEASAPPLQKGITWATAELRRLAAEAQQQKPTPCSPFSICEDGGEPCANHEREQAHAEGEHCFCGPECAEAQQQPAADDNSEEADANPRAVCVCGHTRGEHIRLGGPFGKNRLLCDVCDPDSTDHLTCEEFEAL